MKHNEAVQVIDGLVGYAKNAVNRVVREVFAGWTYMIGKNPFSTHVDRLDNKAANADMVFMVGKFTHVTAVMEMLGRVAEFHSTVGNKITSKKKDILLLPTAEPQNIVALFPKDRLVQLNKWEGRSLEIARMTP